MFDIVGFVDIVSDTKTCNGAEKPEDFMGKTCAVMEFHRDGGVMVLNPEGNALAMFEKKDVYRRFICGFIANVVTPPDLDEVQKMMYVFKAQNRKGGYCGLVRNMVIERSLMKGEFDDRFLWQRS